MADVNIRVFLLTVSIRTVARVTFFYPLQPPNALAETRTVIIFQNLPAIGLRPKNFVNNMTDYIGLFPYRRGENVTIVTIILLAKQSELVMMLAQESNDPLQLCSSRPGIGITIALFIKELCLSLILFVTCVVIRIINLMLDAVLLLVILFVLRKLLGGAISYLH